MELFTCDLREHVRGDGTDCHIMTYTVRAVYKKLQRLRSQCTVIITV